MSDWGKGATSTKTTTAQPKQMTAFLVCENCNNPWTYVYDWPYQLNEIRGPKGGYLCKECREDYQPTIHTSTPPPEGLQVMIDDILNTKK